MFQMMFQSIFLSDSSCTADWKGVHVHVCVYSCAFIHVLSMYVRNIQRRFAELEVHLYVCVCV
jgi:hypothetical protein